MGRMSMNNSGKFASQGNNDFFFLTDDGDVASVRMLYDQPDGSDMDYYLVHEVEIDGKKRYVACNALSEDGNSLHTENCPLCQAGYKRLEKLFIQMYIPEEDAVKTWDRGRNFVQKIQTYINRYGSLVNYPIEIERKGKAGDSNTTYELFVMENDGMTLEDFPEKQELLGSFILEVSDEDMQKMIDGTFTVEQPAENNNRRERNDRRQASPRGGNSAPVSRQSSRSSQQEAKSSAPAGRRGGAGGSTVRRGRRSRSDNY